MNCSILSNSSSSEEALNDCYSESSGEPENLTDKVLTNEQSSRFHYTRLS